MTTTDVDTRAGKVLRLLALHRDETVEVAAAAAGMSRDTVYRRLRGKGEWKAREIEALAAHFRVSPEVFFRDPGALFGDAYRPMTDRSSRDSRTVTSPARLAA